MIGKRETLYLVVSSGFVWFFSLDRAIGIATIETCLFRLYDQILLQFLLVFRAWAMRRVSLKVINTV